MTLEDSLDRLYSLAPERFVVARDELVRELRAAGQRTEAGEMARLRRPTMVAWALNQLVRRRPEGVRRLVEAGDDLRRAQRRALAGVRDTPLREASGRRRELLAELTEEAVAVLAEAGRGDTGSHREAIVASLEAASADAEAAEALLRGRLATELSPPTGFADVGDLTLVTPPSPGSRRAGAGRAEEAGQAGRDERAGQTQLDRARRAVEASVREARQRQGEARRAAAGAEEARRRADVGRQQVLRLEDELRAADHRARAAEREAEEWCHRSEEAAALASRAEEAAERARSELARLESEQGWPL